MFFWLICYSEMLIFNVWLIFTINYCVIFNITLLQISTFQMYLMHQSTHKSMTLLQPQQQSAGRHLPMTAARKSPATLLKGETDMAAVLLQSVRRVRRRLHYLWKDCKKAMSMNSGCVLWTRLVQANQVCHLVALLPSTHMVSSCIDKQEKKVQW